MSVIHFRLSPRFLLMGFVGKVHDATANNLLHSFGVVFGINNRMVIQKIGSNI